MSGKRAVEVGLMKTSLSKRVFVRAKDVLLKDEATM